MTEVFIGDTLFSIIKYLSGKDFLHLIQTNKQINEYCKRKEHRIWSFMLKRDFPQRSDGYGLEKRGRKNLYRDLFTRKSHNKHSFTPKDVPSVFNMFPNDKSTKYGNLHEAYNMSTEAITLITKSITAHIDKGKYIIPGDGISFTWISAWISVYNKRMLIWDGFVVVELDVYGFVPQQFKYPKYPPTYFPNCISHDIIHICIEDKAYESFIDNYNDETRLSYLYDHIRDIRTNITFAWESRDRHPDFVSSKNILHKYFNLSYRQNYLSHRFLLHKDNNGGFKITIHEWIYPENNMEMLKTE